MPREKKRDFFVKALPFTASSGVAFVGHRYTEIKMAYKDKYVKIRKAFLQLGTIAGLCPFALKTRDLND